MALVVEDGTGLANAESYLSESEFELRAEALALSYDSTADLEAALRRATRYIDGRYSGRWPGYKVGGRDQALAWPRSRVLDSHGDDVPDDEVPEEIKRATTEAAARESTSPGSLTPDADPRRVISESVGPVAVTYADDGSASSTRPVVTIIDELLWPLLLPGGTAIRTLMRA